jgi:phosphohistidine phosphatase
MKTLYLIRHGHAETKARQPDHERNLDDAGREEVRITAEKMLAQQINPDLIISSHADRAMQSAEIIAAALGYNSKNIEIEKGIYYTDTETLENILEQQDDKYHSIVLAGHNPTITDLARSLSKEYIDSLPTGGLVAFELQTNSWSSFKDNNKKYLFHIYPLEG